MNKVKQIIIEEMVRLKPSYDEYIKLESILKSLMVDENPIKEEVVTEQPKKRRGRPRKSENDLNTTERKKTCGPKPKFILISKRMPYYIMKKYNVKDGDLFVGFTGIIAATGVVGSTISA